GAEDNWDRLGGDFGGKRAGPAARHSDYLHAAAHEIGRQFAKAPVLAFRPGELQGHVLTLVVTAFCEPFAECGHLRCPLGGGTGVKEPNPRHPLLRARSERPRYRRPSEQRDELAPLHVEHGASFPSVAPLVAGRVRALAFRLERRPTEA